MLKILSAVERDGYCELTVHTDTSRLIPDPAFVLALRYEKSPQQSYEEWQNDLLLRVAATAEAHNDTRRFAAGVPMALAGREL